MSSNVSRIEDIFNELKDLKFDEKFSYDEFNNLVNNTGLMFFVVVLIESFVHHHVSDDHHDLKQIDSSPNRNVEGCSEGTCCIDFMIVVDRNQLNCSHLLKSFTSSRVRLCTTACRFIRQAP